MIFYIALGVSVLLFGFLAYMATRNWYVSHVVLLSFVFVFALGFMVLAALTLRTQDAWRSLHDNLTRQIADVDASIESLRYVNPLDAEDMPSLPASIADLGRLIIDRGRIWRNAQPVEAQGTGFVLSMAEWGEKVCVAVRSDQDIGFTPEPAADPAGAGDGNEAAANNPHGIVEGSILHAFVESPIPDGLGPILFGDSILATERAAVCKLPVAYVGKYKVTAQNEASITVEPLIPLDERQIDAIGVGDASWALYEQLPQDSHDAYSGIADESLASLFPIPAGDFAQNLLRQSLEEFKRDQGPATRDDPPQFTRVKIEFLQPHTIQVDLEDEPQEPSRTYDAFGRAVMAGLKQGEPTEFQIGDISQFDDETADRLVKESVAKFVDEQPIYNRPLRNYELQLRQRADDIADVAFRTLEMEKKLAATLNAHQLLQEQIAYRRDETQKLKADKSGFQAEQEIVKSFLAQMKSQRDEQLHALSTTYRQNISLRASLANSGGMLLEDSRATPAGSFAQNR